MKDFFSTGIAGTILVNGLYYRCTYNNDENMVLKKPMTRILVSSINKIVAGFLQLKSNTYEI